MDDVEGQRKALSVSAILPAHNEAENLDPLVGELVHVLEDAAVDFEVIIVDDGSDDETPRIAGGLARSDPRIRAIHHSRNRGYGAALRSGFAAARHDWIFFTDADGQFEVEEFAKLIPLASENDFVSGYRKKRSDPWSRRAYGKMFSATVRTLFDVKIQDVNCAFKLFKKHLIEDAGLSMDGALINAELLTVAKRKGVDPAQVAITHRPRRTGESSGGSPRVILRAAREILQLWLRTRESKIPCAARAPRTRSHVRSLGIPRVDD